MSEIKNINLDVSNLGDWEELSINGKVVASNHSLTAKDVLEALVDYFPTIEITISEEDDDEDELEDLLGEEDPEETDLDGLTIFDKWEEDDD